jgi:hypothetical protein
VTNYDTSAVFVIAYNNGSAPSGTPSAASVLDLAEVPAGGTYLFDYPEGSYASSGLSFAIYPSTGIGASLYSGGKTYVSGVRYA